MLLIKLSNDVSIKGSKTKEKIQKILLKSTIDIKKIFEKKVF
jgi:hypothetical protein